MKLKSFRNLWFVGVAVIFVGAISVALWLRSVPTVLQLENVSAQPEAAKLVPRNTPFMVSTLVNLDQLKQSGLSSMTSSQRTQVRKDIAQLQRTIESSIGLDYASDIAPWAGDELTLALTSWDIDRNLDNGATPGYLLVVSIGNREQADTALQQIWQRQSRFGERTVEDYSGVAIRFSDAFSKAGISTTDDPLIATAQIGQHYVLFSNSPNVLRNAINTLQASQRSLDASPVYGQVLSQLPTERIALVWMNVPEARLWWSLHRLGMEEVTDVTTRIDREIQAPASDPGDLTMTLASLSADDRFSSEGSGAQSIEVVATSVAIAPSGLVADTILTPTSGTTFASHVPQPLNARGQLSYIPSDSSFVLTSYALSEATQALEQFADHGNPLAQRITDGFAHRQAQWPVDDSDWDMRDYAIARVLDDVGSVEQADWIAVIPATVDAKATVQRFDEAAGRQGLNVDRLPIADQATSVWTELQVVVHPDSISNPVSLNTNVVGIHAESDEYEVLATSVNAMGKALLFEDTNLLANSQFQTAIATLDDQNDGYLYIEWNLARAVLTEAFPMITPFLDLAKPVLDPLRSLVMTRYESQPDAQRFGAVLQYQPKAQET
ncbi:MAG: DUF3352 domain-containing protein [Cyanobacteria bacterium J06626_14]